ncbi:hypothetical protein Hanom_Chr06g00524651 [Helianthus anomalus]
MFQWGQLCGHPRSNISHFKDSCERCTSTTQHLLKRLKFKKIMMNCLISLMKLMSPMRCHKKSWVIVLLLPFFVANYFIYTCQLV